MTIRVDQVPDIDEMYAVGRTEEADGPPPLTRAAYDALRVDTQAFADVYATVPDIDLHVDGRTMAVTLAATATREAKRTK